MWCTGAFVLRGVVLVGRGGNVVGGGMSAFLCEEGDKGVILSDGSWSYDGTSGFEVRSLS